MTANTAGELRPLSALIDLSGRCAVVTGAARGFGFAIARRLAEAGAHLVVADVDASGAAVAAKRLEAAGWSATGRQLDVSDESSVEALFADFDVDILVNNAGVFSNYLVEAMPATEFRRILDVNVTGSFLCSRSAARQMRASGRRGTIVNVASVDAVSPSAEGLAHYTTSKHAIAGLTRTLAMELAPAGIRVNAVCPGAAMTEGAIELVTAGAPDGIDVAAQWDGIKDRTPLGRLCDPDDVGRAVVFLASDLGAFVTGILLPVDGGILVQPLEGYVPADPEQGEVR
jgi:NAD(P)-dependent dehydrogenase (short-subunit alcohol dehydrogenase family)